MTDVFTREKRSEVMSRIRSSGTRPEATVAAANGGVMAHWSEPRHLSGAEIARLQSFPDDYDFCGMDAKYVCGMSVPPLMMERLAHEIRRQLLGKI